ncbi:Vacuolar protein sorting-associated protein 54 [Colletotrichum tanaceti]|uniref:Vacuolar protein sorting-associated protein 54 n=1 Tax=Colletotrichum tanaceti TaxID=1306861 RepID=A0A4U6XQZ1_9PEZI|nr:Vacuolar protein sorting-associated protein 54 [Colletotrichum tanaceti]
MGPLYEQLQRLKGSEGGRRAAESSPKSSFGRFEASRQTAELSNPARDGTISSIIPSATALVDEGLPNRQESGIDPSRGGHHAAAPLSIVPDVYFHPQFHLENPRIFDVVSEKSQVVPPDPTAGTAGDGHGHAPAPPGKALATNAILQEKLSWYMDTVETHLVDSLATASPALFSALGSLTELHSEAGRLADEVAALRRDLMAPLDRDVVARGLELTRKRQESRNLRQIHDAILQLERIVDGVVRCESLVDGGQLDKALAEMNVVESLMAGERGEDSEDGSLTHTIQLRDLRGAAALRGVAGDLTILRSRIGTLFESEVHNQLIGDLRRHVRSVSTEEVLSRWEAESLRAKGGLGREPPALPAAAYTTQTSELRTALFPIVNGLHRYGSVSTAIGAYRQLVLREIRGIVRKPLPSSTDADDTASVDNDTSAISGSTIREGRNNTNRTSQEKSSLLARRLSALDAEDAERLLSAIVVPVAETLRRLKAQSSILLDIAWAVGNPDAEDRLQVQSSTIHQSHVRGAPNVAGIGNAPRRPMLGILEEMHAALDLPGLLGEAVDASHEMMGKILRVRSEQTAGLPLAYFLRYYALNLLFVNECEAVSGRAGISLKTVVNGHVQDFIQAHGDRESRAFARAMDLDTWQDADFTARDHETLQQILECDTADPPAWTATSRVGASLLLLPPLQEETEEMRDAEEDNNTAKGKTRGATIEGETFVLPRSAILCLEGTSRFLRLMAGVPSMTPAIAASLTSYLRLFDSRCRQLILGAGALRSAAGLTNVTTTHLARTSQALSFVSAVVVPRVRDFVRRHAPAGADHHLAGGFDEICRAVREHRDAIHRKLVDIMASRARQLSRKALEVDWDGERRAGEVTVRAYMAELAGDTGRLHKTLRKRLPHAAVQYVMVQVFASYKHHLGMAFREAELETESGRECMLRDVQHLVDKLGDLEGFGDLGTCLTRIINGKDIVYVAESTASPPPQDSP